QSEDAEDPRPPELVLITGFPAFTAKRMIAKVLSADAAARVFVLAREKFGDDARDFLAALPRDHGKRAEIVAGDVCNMDLGLSGSEYQTLTNEVTTIHHLAGIYYLGVDKATARRVNIEGTRGVIELASECKRLRRLCHWSTASVSGKRKGVILEEELDDAHGFHNFYEESKFVAEKLAATAGRNIPITIFRPGIIVGDSETGEIDKFDGPYYLMVLIVTNTLQVHLPLPGRGTAPLNLVPIDYVIDAGYALSIDVRAAGHTFHLTDPNPFSARRVYELVAERSHTKSPRGFIPARLARALLKTPGIERLARAPLSFLESFDHQVFYNCRSALRLCDESAIRCPSFDSYVDKVVHYVREVHAAKRKKIDDEVFDPFD
ncbi:MAG: SDR family oxidoreductase, partial [Deltaproteobacteria bacterium]|nr:SDR family oxidoreductase [Deltaproteobacteria bacterium]